MKQLIIRKQIIIIKYTFMKYKIIKIIRYKIIR